jgi:hypothetical protein
LKELVVFAAALAAFPSIHDLFPHSCLLGLFVMGGWVVLVVLVLALVVVVDGVGLLALLVDRGYLLGFLFVDYIYP